jgi:hypothetical protein
MHLNAFNLAVENDHFEIMNMFLKMNSSLADIISLYQASKNGYQHKFQNGRFPQQD